MKLILLFFGLSLLSTSSSRRRICHACFEDICYSRSLIFDQYPISGQLAVDKVANILHFHYEEPKSSDHTVAFDLEDVRLTNIPELQFSFARTVDQKTRDVYIGGANGIYKFNPVTNSTMFYALRKDTIWHMQFNEKLYYTIFFARGLFTYENKKTKSITALSDFVIDDFIVDKKEDIYFTSNSTLYKLKKGDTKASIFKNQAYSLTTDLYDNAYFVQKDSRGLFKIDYSNNVLKSMGAFGSGIPFRLVFDRYNNVIYFDSETRKLFYLVPNYAHCKVKTEGLGRKIKMMVSQI